MKVEWEISVDPSTGREEVVDDLLGVAVSCRREEK